MSKSKGNVVDPFDQMQKFSSDGLRYFLLKEGVPHSDGSKIFTCICLIITLPARRIRITEIRYKLYCNMTSDNSALRVEIRCKVTTCCVQTTVSRRSLTV